MTKIGANLWTTFLCFFLILDTTYSFPSQLSEYFLQPQTIDNNVDIGHDNSRLYQETVPSVPLSKRGCTSFACVYTHIAGKAGRQSLMKAFASQLSNCARNPRCSPGKRAMSPQERNHKQNGRQTFNSRIGNYLPW